MTDATAVRALMAEMTGEPVSSLADETPLDSISGDSFSLVELVIAMQEQLGVRFGQADMQGVTTVGGLVGVFVARSQVAA